MTKDTPLSRWPIGGGSSGDLIRAIDWGQSPLGPVGQWPPHLRTKVNSMINSPIPQVLMWGPGHVMLYNDGYIPIAGDKHPAAMGGTVPGIWPEIWDWNREVLAAGLAGNVQSFRDQHMILHRNGRPEEVVFDLFYTPIFRDDGLTVDGVLCTVLDITVAVRAREALAESRAELAGLTDALPMLVGFLEIGRASC